jgi:ribosomal protein L31
MNNCKHLKKNKILMQFSDGSSVYLFCSTKKKELLTEVDIRSNIFWNNGTVINETTDNKDKALNNFKKLFLKLK